MDNNQSKHATKIIDEQQKQLGIFTVIPNRMRAWIQPLGPTAFTVWYVLKSFAQENEEISSKINQKDLAEYCGISTSAFVNAIKRLVDFQFLEVIQTKEKYKPTYFLKEHPLNISQNRKSENEK